MSPFLVFLALAFWTWLWGPIGAFLAMPLLIMSFVVLGHLLPREEGDACRANAHCDKHIPMELSAPQRVFGRTIKGVLRMATASASTAKSGATNGTTPGGHREAARNDPRRHFRIDPTDG